MPIYEFYDPLLARQMSEIPEMVTIRDYNNTLYVQIGEEYFFLGKIELPDYDWKVKSWKVTGNTIKIFTNEFISIKKVG